MLEFDNSYARLPERFFTKMRAEPVSAPALLKLNDALAAEMGLDTGFLASADGLAMLAGNSVPDGAEPLAQVYAGHQFGGWSPRLGDGRALLLGEVTGPDGAHWDIQLKGSGPTPYSRSGDGRAWLGPVLREYIVSEAMSAFGVPTTRALAAVSTGETVLREQRYPGAILTRVASSHVRVGTFQYFASQQDTDGISALLNFAITRHYPDLEQGDALGFLKAVIAAQANLVAKWMGLGFIHGVMNTDNCHVGGLTIDYGPCAFMDAYHPSKVFSSIDQFGRYAYGAQPEILVWNLAQLATSLLPLIDDNMDKAVEAAQAALQGFGPAYTDAWKEVFFAKLGLPDGGDTEVALVQDLLTRMAENQADFTLTFRGLLNGTARDQFVDPTAFDDWASSWNALSPDAGLMARANPAFIPRNHQIELAIKEAVAGDLSRFHRIVSVLATPFEDQPDHSDLQSAPVAQELVHQTFCGT
ncbi:YdiU family protein [uncultured Litoreibacter sp.]|uniref:protein adenylyltransferase SelO n=1 Tax=uncultured Litoreibacter sp. TaxID=1392394 RepID=UPI00262F8B5C|nr:YdiU family protein [uncultured Litoreibacter sp.]